MLSREDDEGNATAQKCSLKKSLFSFLVPVIHIIVSAVSVSVTEEKEAIYLQCKSPLLVSAKSVSGGHSQVVLQTPPQWF